MSEYQYYEFQAPDRPLGQADQEALRAVSTRARIREQAQAEKAAARRKRLEAEAERSRRVRLDPIMRRGESVCQEIEIARRNATGYDKATGLLLDLRAIAEKNGATENFASRLQAIRKRHARKERFIERPAKLG